MTDIGKPRHELLYEIGALRAALITTTRSLESAATFVDTSDRRRARWMRQDVELGQAALQSPGALMQLVREREQRAVRGVSDAA